MFYSRIYLPRFSSTSYEENLQQKLLNEQTSSWDKKKYQALLNLKTHASRVAASLHQLKTITGSQNVKALDEIITRAINNAVNDERFNASLFSHSLGSAFATLEREIQEDQASYKAFAYLNLVTNSIIATISGAGILLFGAALATAPFSIMLLGIGMTLLSALTLTITAYSAYVDNRFIAGKQLQEIDKCIKQLNAYPNEPELAPDEANHSCCLF
ncbi:hypothetical protein [Legionella cardiaca]|uniref:Inclusion membrane protein A n=1 Tax=Legionella cardiaca TaxID=1071983 RepID=A0ABY8AV71_9GAMM|nr:hypothetical protein [Legionella cardiaca]WED44585.1 hypothetical protein PXX05_07295 [Legionella cardiaca]